MFMNDKWVNPKWSFSLYDQLIGVFLRIWPVKIRLNNIEFSKSQTSAYPLKKNANLIKSGEIVKIFNFKKKILTVSEINISVLS